MTPLPLDKDDIGRLALRLGLGLTLLLHGLAKLTTPSLLTAIAHTLETAGLPAFLAYATLIAEIGGSLMILLGWRARLGALLVAAEIAAAIALVPLSQVLSLRSNGGWTLELPAMLLAGAAVIVLLGSGRLALRPD
ncbi:DoxX family membrane protein [Salinicola aestuarinus]|uniref:DoxX family membrane protein n=1 Tax=Salinicola aestuarinus TaxID=1949082 RepID=UPI0013008B40|nr:DoxX family membrane protein [Salinicola aestuarinus]